MIRLFLTVLCLFAAAPSLAEIHTCEDEFGNVAYQQTPCPEVEEAVVLEPTTPAEPSPSAELAQEPVPQGTATTPKSSEDVEACKEPLRDAIDAIEAQMLRGYSAEQGEEFKQELRGLTQQMRACE